jgi:ribonuclease P protein component
MLPRAGRLRRNRDFRLVFSKRRSFGSELLTLYVRPQRPATGDDAGSVQLSRFGFVISKKTARRAHDRNRIKRRLREICRLRVLPRLRGPSPVDIVFVARAPAAEADFARLAAEVETLGRKAGLL